MPNHISQVHSGQKEDFMQLQKSQAGGSWRKTLVAVTQQQKFYTHHSPQ